MIKYRYLIFSLVVSLTFFGLLMIGSASVVNAARDFGDKWYYLKLQSVWALVGLAAFFFFSKFPHRKLEKYAFSLFIITLVLLFTVLIPGIGTKLLGARRWIIIGPLSIQPAEIAKLTLSLYFATLLKKKHIFTQFLGVLGVVSFLVILEPDMGTALVLCGMGIFLYFGSGGNLSRLFTLAPIFAVGIILLIIISPYRFDRLRTFLDYSRDPLGSSYQIHQALLGFGSGGVFGMGLGQSRQKYEFLPEATTDSIFSVIGEELGFIGTVSLTLAFMALIYYGLEVARFSQTPFSVNLAISLSCIIGIQVFMNLSAITALMPLTGIPLTFISYGGSALSISLAASGILLNIARSVDYDTN